MIGLENKSLSQASLNQLAVYQSAIDEKRTYTEQIELAGKWRDKTNNRIFKEVKEKLISMCTNRTQRCMYCEDSASTDIEHFAPKSIYPNLTFVWDNYLYACSGCNSSSKGNKFAIFRTKDGVFEDITPTKATVRVPPVAGNPVLINPREEDPLHFLELDILGSFYFRPITKNEASKDFKRADYTIDILGLNRESLAASREEAFDDYIDRLSRYKERRNNDNVGRLERCKRRIVKGNYQSVWYEMKRWYNNYGKKMSIEKLKDLEEDLQELKQLFDEVPEALTW